MLLLLKVISELTLNCVAIRGKYLVLQIRDKLQEPLPKVELGSTFRATCLATILAVAGCYTVKCFVQLVPPKCRQNIARHFTV